MWRIEHAARHAVYGGCINRRAGRTQPGDLHDLILDSSPRKVSAFVSAIGYSYRIHYYASPLL